MDITIVKYDWGYFGAHQNMCQIGLKMWDASYVPSSYFINWDWYWNSRVVVGSLKKSIVLE